ncbi:MAG: hypothetical protein JO341_03270 [Gammaproteobacteria bacterium]|nr:hypothetical protein [Gammaproteobacteria bacterium]MBV9620021.1 hypothetical protein [Gammaproteobacteria bacterium]
MRAPRLLILLLLCGSCAARGEAPQVQFLLLPSAEAVGTFARDALVTQPYDEVLRADMILSLQRGPFRLFTEYLLSDHEGDLERFQLGYQFSSDTVLWLGRFHQPTSVWNHDHHHGQYLQTSITRPAIEEWEDLGGILPQHFTGALLETSRPLASGWRLRMAGSGGLAPQLNPGGLEPFDLVHPDHHRRQLGYHARLSLHPGDLDESGFGVLLAREDLARIGPPAASILGLDHVQLSLYGVFASYVEDPWRLLAVLFHADARLFFDATPSRGDSFALGYTQAERRFGHDLTAFVRLEGTAQAADSRYLGLFPAYPRSRQLAGVRWDFAPRQAFTLQLTNSHTFTGHFADVRVQWSAALL